jgi:hypothetical protein
LLIPTPGGVKTVKADHDIWQNALYNQARKRMQLYHQCEEAWNKIINKAKQGELSGSQRKYDELLPYARVMRLTWDVNGSQELTTAARVLFGPHTYSGPTRMPATGLNFDDLQNIRCANNLQDASMAWIQSFCKECSSCPDAQDLYFVAHLANMMETINQTITPSLNTYSPREVNILFTDALQEYAAIYMPQHEQTLNEILESTARVHEEFCRKNLGLEYDDRPVGGNGAPGENGLDEEEHDEI